MNIKIKNKDISSEYYKLMKGEITNKEFEDLTGAEPEENNPSRKDWLERKMVKNMKNKLTEYFIRGLLFVILYLAVMGLFKWLKI